MNAHPEWSDSVEGWKPPKTKEWQSLVCDERDFETRDGRMVPRAYGKPLVRYGDKPGMED